MTPNSPDLQIRLAAPEDATAIAEVLRAAFAEYAQLYTPEGLAATTPSSERIAGRFAEGPVWVAEAEGVIIATVAAVPRGEALYVRSMAALPSARGRGVGRLLFAEVERHARAEGHARLTLSTTPFLARAIRLYESLGFRRDGDGPRELCGTPLFTMSKPLGPGEPA
jgi:GNAT superfamily N-acetyltransferase